MSRDGMTVGIVTPLDPDGSRERKRTEFRKLVRQAVKLKVRFQREDVAEDGSQLPITSDTMRRLGDDTQVGDLATALAAEGVSAIAYACTSASFAGGEKWSRRQVERMELSSGVPATNTSLASVDALKAVGVTRIGIATPYIDELNERLVSFFGNFEIDVRKVAGLQLLRNHASLPTEAIISAAEQAATKGVDGIFIACTGQVVADQIEPLEERLGLPVVTANQATLWRVVQLAGMFEKRGVGRLFAGS